MAQEQATVTSASPTDKQLKSTHRTKNQFRCFLPTGSNDAARFPCRKEVQSSERTLERMREAYEKVAKDEIGRVPEILRKSTDFLRRVIAPVDGMGGVTLSCVCPHCNSFSFGGLHLVGMDGTRKRQQKEEKALQLVVRGLWRPIRMDSA